MSRHILSALRGGTLSAFVLQYDGKTLVIPKEYWDDEFADATLATGEFCGIGKSKNLKDRPIVLHAEDWENWTKEHARLQGRRVDDANAPTADQEPLANRRRPAEQMHKRWTARAKELRAANKDMKVTEIARKIWREDAKAKDPNTKGQTRDPATIRRVLYEFKSEWDIPQES